MSGQIGQELWVKTFRVMIEETFEKVEGIYLDQKTSLFETLAKISAEEASRPLREGGPTIAGHVEHARFYLGVMRDYMQGMWYEKVDWKGSWHVTGVTPAEWEELQGKLRDMYREVAAVMDSFVDWNDERKLGGAMGVLAHTAYHLGAIRGGRG